MFSRIRAQYIRVMSKLWVRKVYLVVGSTIGVGLFYRSFIKSVFFPGSGMTPEELKYYDIDNIYAVRKKKEEIAAKQRMANTRSQITTESTETTQTSS